MAFSLTENQHKAVYGNTPMLVSAAAGSGKTAVLSKRALRLMTDENDPVYADRLLIVTFTNAAASEMRERISKELRSASKTDPGSMLLKKQRSLLSRAPICTIDSFCYDLVKKYFHVLGISPEVRIIDRGQLNILKRRALGSVLEEYFSASDSEFIRLLDCLGADNPELLYEPVFSMQEFLSSLPFAGQWLSGVRKMYTENFFVQTSPWVATVLQTAQEKLESAYGLLDRAITDIKNDDKLYAALYDQYKDAYEQIRRMCDVASRQDWDGLHNMLFSFKFEKSGVVRGHEDKAFADSVKAVRGSVLKTVEEISSLIPCSLKDAAEDIKESVPLIDKLIEIIERYKNVLDGYKKERSVLDFSDIEALALSLLVEKKGEALHLTDIAKEVSSQYDEVLIDEYQDVNDLQDTLLYALSGGGERLFMVGDVKQSIYRFRQANPGLFIKKREVFSRDGKSDSYVVLGENFRSRPGICDTVNFFFRRLMTSRAAEMDYTKDEELVPASCFEPSKEPESEIHIIDKQGIKEPDAVLEARYIAAYIKEKMQAAPFLKDAETGGLRRARYGDFAILLRSPSTKADIYYSELKRAGIPVWAELGGGFFSSPEIMTVISLLRVIDNPLRDIPLMSVLMSPFYGYTADAAAQIRTGREGMSLYEALCAAAESDDRAADVISDIDAMRKKSLSMTADEFIIYLYAKTGYLSLVQAMENGRQKKANLLMLLDMARSFEKGSGRGISAFTGYLNNLEDVKSDMACAPAASESDDAVKIMSIHRSKGLQFPICIMASCASRFNRTDINNGLVMHRDTGIGLMCFDNTKGVRYDSLPRAAISLNARRDLISEEMRILYVAMTRAEERLVFVMTLDNAETKIEKTASSLSAEFSAADEPISPTTVLSAEGFGDWILMCALLHPSGGTLREMAFTQLNPASDGGDININIVAAGDIKSSDQSVFAAAEADEKILKNIKDALEYRYPYEEAEALPVKLTASELTHERGGKISFASRPTFLHESGMTPAEQGTALHEFMQYADYDGAAADIEMEIERLVNRKFITKEQGESIDREKAAVFFQSDLFSRMKNSCKLRREWRFMLDIPAGSIFDKAPDGTTVVIQGIIDCFFEENGSIVIVDYKTDKVKTEEELIKRYRDQLRLYSYAVKQLYGADVKEGLIYSFELGKSIKID